MKKRLGIPAPLGREEGKAVLDRLGLWQHEFAVLGGLSKTSMSDRLKAGLIGHDAVLLRLLDRHPELLEEAFEAAGLDLRRLRS